MSTFAELFEAEAQQAAPKAAPPKTPKTDKQAQGVADLDTMIGQMQANLRDVKPGSEMHARLTRDLAEAQKERAKYGAPAQPSGSFADQFEALAAAPAAAPAPAPAPAAQQAKSAGIELANQLLQKRQQLGETVAGAGEAGLSMLTGGIAAPLGAVGGVLETLTGGKFGTPEGIKAGQAKAAAIQQALTYQPRTQAGQQIMAGLGTAAEAAKLPPVLPEALALQTTVGPAIRQARQAQPLAPVRQAMAELEGRVPVQGQVMTPQAVQQMQAQFAAKQPGAPMVGMGAAMTTDANMIRAALTQASPELQQAVSSIPFDKVNLPTLQRHIEADQLPIPVRLTEGQATGDVVKLSREQNRRGVDPALAQRFNEQNGQLVENLNAIKERAAPDVYSTRTIDNSQALIDAYKALDDTRSEQISAAYKALTDANGGQFPVDGARIAKNSETALAKQLKSDFVPSAIAKQLERFKTEQMTFEQFEALRTNIAAEMRKAERAGDGNAAAALSIVRNQMEALPLSGTAAASLKPLADQARSLAKARFDALKADPAYKAAVMDSVPADKFMDKFVIKGINKNINRMIDTFGRDSVPVQEMRAGVINHLRERAGIIDDQGNFSQAGYNKALKGIDSVKNLDAIFDPDSNQMLKSLGNVARYTQAQPKGSFVNNSNTLVAGLAERAAGLAETGANVVFGQQLHGLPVGTILRQGRKNIIERQETKRSLELGAGTKVEK